MEKPGPYSAHDCFIRSNFARFKLGCGVYAEVKKDLWWIRRIRVLKDYWLKPFVLEVSLLVEALWAG